LDTTSTVNRSGFAGIADADSEQAIIGSG